MSSPDASASLASHLSYPRPKTYRWSLSFADLAGGLSIFRDLTIWNGRASAKCSRDMFEASMTAFLIPESRYRGGVCNLQCRDEQVMSEFYNLLAYSNHLKNTQAHIVSQSRSLPPDIQKRIDETNARMIALVHLSKVIKTVAQSSSEIFPPLVQLLTQAKPWTSKMVFQPEQIMRKLISKHNFTIQLNGFDILCNQVIAASISKVIARALEEEPTRRLFSISQPLPKDTISLLSKMLEGQEIILNQHTMDDILEIDTFFEFEPIRPLLDQLAEENRVSLRNFTQLMRVADLQKHIDSLNEENYVIVLHRIKTEFRNDLPLCRSIVKVAKNIRPKHYDLYRRLKTVLDKEKIRRPPRWSSSDFLEILKADNVDLFRSQWESFPVIRRAIPVVSSLYHWLNDVSILHDLHLLPAASVAAFYGAENCLKFLIVNHPEKIKTEKTLADPFCFAIAGGNIPTVLLLSEHSVSKPEMQIAFAVCYHQEEILHWLIQKTDSKIVDRMLLPASACAQWFYGLSYCINHGIHTHQLQAIKLSGQLTDLTMFWFLIVLDSSQSLKIDRIMPIVVSWENSDWVKRTLDLMGEAQLSREGRWNCLIQAIDVGLLEFLDDIWKLFDFDELLTHKVPSSVARHIKESQDGEIIRKFLKYGNIFPKGADVLDWLDELARKGDIEMIEVITDDADDYFKHFPRNPLPFAVDIDTAEYLLDHGADPNYRGQDGFTRMDLAIRNKELEMIELLKRFGAEPGSEKH
jgi:hypothetical protein